MSPRPRFRPARQARSQQTLARILDAARAIVREVGLDGLTVNEVTRRSGVTTGSFYARFAGRDALVHWLENRYWEDVEERWRAFLEPGRWSDRNVAERVDGLVRGVCRSYRVGAAELRIFLLHACANPDGKPLRRVMVLEEGVARRVSSLLAPWDGVTHPEPARAAAFATEQLLAALRGEVLVGKGAAGEGAPTFSPKAADDERVRAFAAYLGLASAARAPVT